jgi:ornithine cyclodeaminase
MPGEVLVLREPEIRKLLDRAGCIEAVERAFSAYASGKAELPAVINLDIPERGGEIHIKAGHLHGGSHYAVKIASGFPANVESPLPINTGMVLVFNAKTGAPGAFLLDNGFITDLRTAAAGAVAAKHLSRKNSRILAIIGAGGQARYQAKLLSLLRPLDEVRIWGRNADRAKVCADELSAARDIAKGTRVLAAESVEHAIEGADIIVTVTASCEPLVRAKWLSAGVLVIAVGSDAPDKRELHTDVLVRADRIVADSLPQCLRLGEIHHGIEAGVIPSQKDITELGEITSGKKPGRLNDKEIIVCDLTGVGVQDVAAANLVLERAQAAHVGEVLAL